MCFGSDMICISLSLSLSNCIGCFLSLTLTCCTTHSHTHCTTHMRIYLYERERERESKGQNRVSRISCWSHVRELVGHVWEKEVAQVGASPATGTGMGRDRYGLWQRGLCCFWAIESEGLNLNKVHAIVLIYHYYIKIYYLFMKLDILCSDYLCWTFYS